MHENEEMIDETTAPNEFLCPIYQQIMKDPVLTADGFCFERRAIQQWFAKGKNTNPLTGLTISSKNLVQNRSLRNVIQHHNQRVRQIQRQAAQNAQSFIKSANQSLAEVFPEMINDMGFLDLDKLIQLATQNSVLRKTLIKSNQNFNEVTKYCDAKDVKNCQTCKSLTNSLKNYKSFVQNDIMSIIKTQSALKGSNLQIEPDEIFCLVINNDIVKGIDFKRIKKADLKKFSIKAVMLKRLTVEELIGKIRGVKKIAQKDFIRLWITGMPTDKLYAHISEQAQVITGPYICKVKCVGKRVQNLKKKVSDLNIAQGEYLIVEHGPGQEFVFRDAQGKCDYCYRMRQINFHCNCKKVLYCSKQCLDKDNIYHQRVCVLNQNGSQKNTI